MNLQKIHSKSWEAIQNAQNMTSNTAIPRWSWNTCFMLC